MLIVSLTGIVLVLACYTLVRKGSPSRLVPEGCARSSWAWSVGFLLALVLMTVLEQAGLVSCGPLPWLALVGSLVLGAVASLWRDRVRERLGALRLRWVVEVAMLLLGTYLTFVVVETPSNPYLTDFNLKGMLIQLVIVLFALSVLHLLFQRTGAGAALGVFALFALGMAEYFVVAFRDEPIMASDVFAVGTAAAVGASYTYVLDDRCVAAVALAAFVILMFSLCPRPRRRGAAGVACNLALALVLLLGGGWAVLNVDITETFGVTVGGWQPLASYRRNGFLTSFLVGAQGIRPEVPEGYDDAEAEELVASYAAAYDERTAADPARQAAREQFEELRPSVVVVMDETFSDMSIYDGLHAGYEGPEWFGSFDEAYLRGPLYVSPYGGGTCNSEFEMLTGMSMSYLGSGVYPYMVYDLSSAPGLGRQFRDLGYGTTAMHPNRATNWNRDVVYPDLGFDEFLSIEDFAGAERLRGKVTDAATFDEIVDLLESSDEPQLVFDVTMQNHSSYDTGLIPEEDLTRYYVDGENDPELDEYLALIDESDAALEELVAELSELDRPVVLVYFGDHQPKIASAYNNRLFPDEGDTVEHEQRRYQTCYMVWANYEIAGTEGMVPSRETPTSTNYLAAQVLELIGAPLTDFQKAQLEVRQGMPLLNLAGYQDAEGAWATPVDGGGNDADGLYDDLATMQYHELFGDGVRYQVGAGAAGML